MQLMVSYDFTSNRMANNAERITPLLVHMWGPGALLAKMHMVPSFLKRYC